MRVMDRYTGILIFLQLATLLFILYSSTSQRPLTEFSDKPVPRDSHLSDSGDLSDIIHHIKNIEKNQQHHEQYLSEKNPRKGSDNDLSSIKTQIFCPEEKYRQQKKQMREIVLQPSTRADDPLLLRYLRTYALDPPSKRMRKRSNKLHFYPQTKVVDQLYSGAEGGFFVECGGLDGERSSNTLWLETKRKWDGVLIEMDPSWYQQLRGKNRKAWSVNACLSITDYPVEMAYHESDGGTGKLAGEKAGVHSTSATTAYCFPLYSILLALNRTRVDYFSLDVEGKELDVLKTIPFDKLDIKILTVEFNLVPGGEAALRVFMKSKGYYEHSKLVAVDTIISMYTNDLVFVKDGTTIPIAIGT